MASTAGAAVGRLEVVEAGRSTDVKLRPVFASGLPGPSYGQKTNLHPTSRPLGGWPLGVGGLLASGDLQLCWDLGDLVAVTSG